MSRGQRPLDGPGVGGGCGKEEGAQRGRDGWILAREGRRGMKSPRWAAPQQPGWGWAPCAPPTVWPGPHPTPGVPPPSWLDSTLASALQLEARPVLPEPKKARQGAEKRPGVRERPTPPRPGPGVARGYAERGAPDGGQKMRGRSPSQGPREGGGAGGHTALGRAPRGPAAASGASSPSFPAAPASPPTRG